MVFEQYEGFLITRSQWELCFARSVNYLLKKRVYKQLLRLQQQQQQSLLILSCVYYLCSPVRPPANEIIKMHVHARAQTSRALFPLTRNVRPLRLYTFFHLYRSSLTLPFAHAKISCIIGGLDQLLDWNFISRVLVPSPASLSNRELYLDILWYSPFSLTPSPLPSVRLFPFFFLQNCFILPFYLRLSRGLLGQNIRLLFSALQIC